MLPTYMCKYMYYDVNLDGWTCRPKQEVMEQERMYELLDTKTLHLPIPYCPSDVKRDKHGNIICWEAKK